MSETPTRKGMGPDEPVGSSRSNHRNRNMFILGGLALVLVAGVILAGVIPTGDRAGSTASDASPTPSASATVEVTTCAEGGECQVGDVGPGGGTIFYVDTGGFTCGEVLVKGCTTLEAGSVSEGQLCSAEYPELDMWAPGISSGEYLSFRSRNKCRGGLLTSVRASTDGGMSDWFVGSTDEVDAAIQADVLGINFNNKAVWTVDQGSGSNRAVMWWYGQGWADQFATTGEGYVIPIRAF